MMSWTIKLGLQQAQVLNALRRAGRSGVLNKDLQHISLRYGARCWELGERGWKIECKRDKAQGKGIHRYILVAEPEIPGMTFKIDAPIDIVSIGGHFSGHKIAGEKPAWVGGSGQKS